MIIERIEPLYVKLQNATGIPKWKWFRATGRLWCVLAVVSVVTEIGAGPGLVLGLAAAILITSSTTYRSAALLKQMQDEADDSMMIVQIPDTARPLVAVFRGFCCLIAVVFVGVQVVGGGVLLLAVAQLLWPVEAYLISFSTYPMTGPTITDKIRAGFRAMFRRPAGSSV